MRNTTTLSDKINTDKTMGRPAKNKIRFRRELFVVANKHYRFSFSDNGLRSNNVRFDEVLWSKKGGKPCLCREIQMFPFSIPIVFHAQNRYNLDYIVCVVLDFTDNTTIFLEFDVNSSIISKIFFRYTVVILVVAKIDSHIL